MLSNRPTLLLLYDYAPKRWQRCGIRCRAPMTRPASLGAHAFGAHGSSACASILRSTRIHLSLLATALTESRPRTSNEHTWVLSVRLPNNTATRSRDADLRLQEREASCGERRGI